MHGDERTLLPGAAGLDGAALDGERTLWMPAPGGQPTLVMPRPAAPTPAAPARAQAALQRLVAGVNPLLGAAGVLLALVAQLRATAAHADPAALRIQLLDRVAEFEAVAAAHGVPRPQIGAARYLLCTFLDEVVAATPWGASGVWAERNLLQEFHDEREGGRKAFELLNRLSADAAANADLLELFCVCLALGFEGRFRGQPDGRAQLDALAARLQALVRPGGAATRTLSPRWQGVAVPQRRQALLPPWVVLALSALAVLALLLVLHARLQAQARPVFRQIHALPEALRPAAPVVAAAAARPRLAAALQAEQAAGALAVRDEALRSVVTLPADRLFDAGSARLRAGQDEALSRLARALQALPGQVTVVGHADDAPSASLQYPSAWHLSRARAQAVAEVLAAGGVDRQRLHAEGRADAQPWASGHDAAARAQNRRIEVELRLPRPER